jgi:hypothetical protein
MLEATVPNRENNDSIGNSAIGMFLTTGLVIFLLGACTTVPDYGPRAPGTLVGFDEVRLASDRYRVDFSGTITSSRQDVQNHLEQRAAELTLQSGFTHFVMGMQSTGIASERQVGFIPDTYLHGPQYFNRARRWSNIPLAAEGIGTRYIASAEVAMLRAEQVRGDGAALAAVDVIRRLQPSPPVHIASAAP